MKPEPLDQGVVYLHAMEIYFTRKPCLVKTVLGSCISVTMFHEEQGIGGICHAALPRCRDRTPCNGACRDKSRYVDCSIQYMLEHFFRLGIDRQELRIKLFGGANMQEPQADNENVCMVGTDNVRAAMDVMNMEGLGFHAADTGGEVGRKIFFNTENGEVILKRLTRMIKT